MEITLNRSAGTIDIMVPRDQVSDELLGVLPEPTATAEGCLTWSIRFGDVTRAPRNTNAATDELLGMVEAIVGTTHSTAARTVPEAEGKIRGTLILSFNHSSTTEMLTSVQSRPILIFADHLATTSSEPIASASSRSTLNTFGVADQITPVLLFANPFAP